LSPIDGELAALSTALCWAFGSVLFTIGGLRIGSANINRGRLIIAAIFLSTTHIIITGKLLPIDATPDRWLWFGLSGIVGFIIGDGMLFEAFVIIGPRLSMLLMALVPVMSALWGWLLFGEYLNVMEITAIAITIAGILWVVSDKQKTSADVRGKRLMLGIALGIGGALGQAIGLALSKKGLAGEFPALSGNVIRVTIAASVLWTITLIGGRFQSTIKSFGDKRATLALCGGAFFGPFIGVWLSLVSIKYAKLGIATTLMSLTPVFLIPISKIVFKEKISLGAIFGTVIALTGAAILLLSK